MKKSILRILCNEFTGKLISFVFGEQIPNCRNKFKRYYVPGKYCNYTVRAMIFWGFYEGAEMRLIPRYLSSKYPVIELGSSLGILSSELIGKVPESVGYTCIEANPFLIDNIHRNINHHNPGRENYQVKNLAIAYSNAEFVPVMVSQNNTQSRVGVGKDQDPQAVMVEAASLSSLAGNPFTLICDIEGMEADILHKDKEAFENCKFLFIELHRTWYVNRFYEVNELKEIILSLHFTLKERDGNVFYFEKEARI